MTLPSGRRPLRRSDVDARGRLILRPFFSYFGSKWTLGVHYPAPRHETVIEPFAGGAGYATRYFRSRVILVESNAKVAALWRFLISVSPKEILALPIDVSSVDDVHGCEEAKILLGFWFQRCSAGTTRRTLSAWGRTGLYPHSFWGESVRTRVARQVEHIRHWRLIEGDYTQAPDIEADWFIDPPYEIAGKQYRSAPIDYAQLADWSRARQGQVIVCENKGATWLPFERFRTAPANSSNGTGRKTIEVIYTQGSHGQMPLRVSSPLSVEGARS